MPDAKAFFRIQELEGRTFIIMIDMENKNYQPNITELTEFIDHHLFNELCYLMEHEYQALQKIEYSGDKLLLGWNLKFKKAGKTLCTIYPREGSFGMLLVVGRKEKPYVEELLPTFSEGFQTIYNNTVEGMGQRWLLLDFHDSNDVYQDVLKVIQIRRQCK